MLVSTFPLSSTLVWSPSQEWSFGGDALDADRTLRRLLSIGSLKAARLRERW
jgi:hypothetical protein